MPADHKGGPGTIRMTARPIAGELYRGWAERGMSSGPCALGSRQKPELPTTRSRNGNSRDGPFAFHFSHRRFSPGYQGARFFSWSPTLGAMLPIGDEAGYECSSMTQPVSCCCPLILPCLTNFRILLSLIPERRAASIAVRCSLLPSMISPSLSSRTI